MDLREVASRIRDLEDQLRNLRQDIEAEIHAELARALTTS